MGDRPERLQRAAKARPTKLAMSETAQPTVHAEMTMEEIMGAVPSAQRALFQRYHIGGCSSCGFQPDDTLAQVCKDHNILDVNEVVTYILQAQQLDDRIQVEPSDVKQWLASGEELTFIDVRMPEEVAATPLAEAEPLDYDNSDRYMCLPKERKIIFACADGGRALDVAAYFIGHGFSNVWTLRGGVAAWSA